MSQPVAVDHVIAHLANTNAPPIIVMDKVNKWFGSLTCFAMFRLMWRKRSVLSFADRPAPANRQ
jgi:hypothetical protein